MPVQDAAFALIQRDFASLFPDRVLVEPRVRWWTSVCPGTSTTAVVLGDRCYSGLFSARDRIDVAWRGTIGDSAYAHELMHYFMDQAGLGSDAAHVQVRYWQAANQATAHLQEEGM